MVPAARFDVDPACLPYRGSSIGGMKIVVCEVGQLPSGSRGWPFGHRCGCGCGFGRHNGTHGPRRWVMQKLSAVRIVLQAAFDEISLPSQRFGAVRIVRQRSPSLTDV